VRAGAGDRAAADRHRRHQDAGEDIAAAVGAGGAVRDGVGVRGIGGVAAGVGIDAAVAEARQVVYVAAALAHDIGEADELDRGGERRCALRHFGARRRVREIEHLRHGNGGQRADDHEDADQLD
jgi:hypothetical protein